jgi:nitroimidazol reductase NimA-like FMN-containing flavoprotein (pyridoxamine 5'-phosphate oxidase superfamily)
MRRKDREIATVEKKLEIIEKNKVCRIALSQNDFPYIVPLNYGYSFKEGVLTLYFHSSAEGKKMDIIKENNNACFEIDCDNKLIEGGSPCSYSYSFKSIIGFGKIIMLNSAAEKVNGLNEIMKHQTGQAAAYNFEENMLKNTAVYKIIVEEFTGKQRGIENA